MTRAPFAPIVFTLNGRRTAVRVHPLRRLLDVLRENCGLTGTKEGCGEGECGACTVVIDGSAVNACLVPVAQVAGSRVLTIEGLKGRHALQRAFAEQGGAQCGICTPGMIMAAVALGPKPTLDDVRLGLAGNICRCTGYEGIYRAVANATGTAAPGSRPAARSPRGARLPAGTAARHSTRAKKPAKPSKTARPARKRRQP